MSNEIAAAIITGAMTIVAAGVAAGAGVYGLRNWRREAPGRRRLEVAEQCLLAAYKFKQDAQNAGGLAVLYLENAIGEELITESIESAVKSLNELKGILLPARLYFGEKIDSPALEISREFNKMRLMLLADREQVTSEDRKVFIESVQGSFGANAFQTKLEKAVAELEALLKPELDLPAG